MPVADKKLKATIYPWSHKFMTIVGLAYVFEDHSKDFLVYLAPQEGVMVCKVHKARITVIDNGRVTLIESLPDAENDPLLTTNKQGEIVLGPASND